MTERRYNKADQALFALVASFDDEHVLKAAARRVREAGYTRTDAYTPFPVHGLAQDLGMRRTLLPWAVLAGGAFGLTGGLALQYWVSVIAYPHNVGGRPLFSWPAFIPVMFELTILCAALAGIIGLFVASRLPQPYHPIFDTPGFAAASHDRFFLSIDATDPRFEREDTRRFLDGLGAREVVETWSDARYVHSGR